MTSLRNMCLNPKIIGTLTVIGVATFVFAPDLVSSVVPLLLLAACPLSMLLMGGAMMRGHHSDERGSNVAQDSPEHGQYYCPMHPDVTSEVQGSCPKCGMRLVAGEPLSREGAVNPNEEVQKLRAEVEALREEVGKTETSASTNPSSSRGEQ